MATRKQVLLLDQLENKLSIELKPGMVIIDDISEKERTFTEEMAKNIHLSGKDVYNFNPCIACYATEGHIYITPMFAGLEVTLKSYGFVSMNFQIPVSNTEYVKGLKSRWTCIKETSRTFVRNMLFEQCKAQSKVSKVKPLDAAFLENCLEIPEKGLTVVKKHEMMVYYPFIHSSLFRAPNFKLVGKYYVDGDITVFVNVDGRTYITKGRVNALLDHGFKKKTMFVPMSNDERMFWPFDKRKWDDIS